MLRVVAYSLDSKQIEIQQAFSAVHLGDSDRISVVRRVLGIMGKSGVGTGAVVRALGEDANNRIDIARQAANQGR